MQDLFRRGFNLGPTPKSIPVQADSLSNWSSGLPVFLPSVCQDLLEVQQDNIAITEQTVTQLLQGNDADDLFASFPYDARIKGLFEPLGSAFNEGDDQEIETVMFDAVDGDSVTAEDLWMKISWLSFHEDDASLRFRFSFGVDFEEDVAADQVRQTAAAKLSDAIFPESQIITANENLNSVICEVLGGEQPSYVERILYFNAPNGGAYLHHDLERGHAGVVYAQVTGKTLWLALPLNELVKQIQTFIVTSELSKLFSKEEATELQTFIDQPEQLKAELNSFSNDSLIRLINETEPFVQQLIGNGFYRVLQSGDAILLPQKDSERCCWHSVFCLGEEMGQALSFAIR